MKGKILLTLAAFSLLSQSVYADFNIEKIEKNFDAGKVTISGKALEKEQISIQILPAEINLKDFAGLNNKADITAYTNSDYADENGEFSFTARIKESGEYNIFTVNESNGEIKSEKLTFVNRSDYSEILRQLNEAETEEEFLNIFEENIEKLGLDFEINEKIIVKDAIGLVYKELGEENMTVEDYKKNITLYKLCASIVALNQSSEKNITTYIDDVVSEDAQMKIFFEKHVNNTEKKEYLTEKMIGRDIDDIDELKDVLKEAIILTAVKYPDGNMNIKDVFDEYKDILNISSASSSEAVYRKIGAKEYNNISDLVSAYKSALSETNHASSGGSGGSGGGTSKKNMSSAPVTSIENPTQNSQNAQVINLKFTDMGSYLWAYPSVSELFDAGIINGVNEYEYMPEKEVKREEFVKLLVCAMNLELTNEKAGFNDVVGGSWYEEYVNTAYKEGIVNGISATEFGIGKSVSRQDMAVMLYNALYKQGVIQNEGNQTFSDENDISDYAKEAVNKLAGAGIINGVGDNLFSPKTTANRAQAAVIIERALDYLR